ncbi:MAG: lactate utilization protein B [Halioglobus sp.]
MKFATLLNYSAVTWPVRALARVNRDGDIHLNVDSANFLNSAHEALQEPEKVQRRDLMGQYIPEARNAAVSKFGPFEALRQHVKRIRQHTLDNLDHYLLQFEQEAVKNGSQVHFARSGGEMNSIVLDICQQHGVRRVAKGKSMVTEETELNRYLISAGLDVMETDLGEYIIQQAGETPSHIIGPALHKSQQEIRELFLKKHDLGPRELEGPAEMVAEARTILRKYFLEAEVGIIGSNALIAENGYSMLVTNEGNGDLCANLPKILIVCTTLERVLPRAEDANAMLRLLSRSAIAQPITSYTSFYSGPRHGEEPDGPLETHFVLLDNNRSDILASDYQEMLHCIRCGSCLTHCPVYIAAGGHAYGSVYSGPMGSVLTPLLTSLEESSTLPNACTTCGRCAEVCPADIPLPDLLRDLRQEEARHKLSSARWRMGIKFHAWLSSHPGLYHWLTGLGISILGLLGKKRGAFRKLPMAGGWTDSRDFPAPQGKTFMQQYKSRGKHRD